MCHARRRQDPITYLEAVEIESRESLGHPLCSGSLNTTFSQMRAFENHERKLYDEDFDYYMKEDYSANMSLLADEVKFNATFRGEM